MNQRKTSEDFKLSMHLLNNGASESRDKNPMKRQHPLTVVSAEQPPKPLKDTGKHPGGFAHHLALATILRNQFMN